MQTLYGSISIPAAHIRHGSFVAVDTCQPHITVHLTVLPLVWPRYALRMAIFLLAFLITASPAYSQPSAWWDYGADHARATITWQELRHAVPKAARSELEKAQKARRFNKKQQVVEHLKRAISIDPEYVAARNSLAITLMFDDPQSAIGQLQKAITIDPYQAALFHNLAIVHLSQNKLDAAEEAARTARRLGLIDVQANIVLAWILIKKSEFTTEAIRLVKSAREEYPIAHMLTARILLGQGQPEDAKRHIQAYLSTGDNDYREYAESWLSQIAVMERRPSQDKRQD